MPKSYQIVKHQRGGVGDAVKPFIESIKNGILAYLQTNADSIDIEKAKRFFLFYYYFDDVIYTMTGTDSKPADTNNKLINMFVKIFQHSKLIDTPDLKENLKAIAEYYKTTDIKNCINNCIDDALKQSANSVLKCFDNEDNFISLINIVIDIIEKQFPLLLKYAEIQNKDTFSTNLQISENKYNKIKLSLQNDGLQSRFKVLKGSIENYVKNIKNLLIDESGNVNLQLINNKRNITQGNTLCNLINNANKYQKLILNFQEDIEGLVRVYIKIRPKLEDAISFDLKIDKNKVTVGKLGPFFGIFDDTNIEMFVGDQTLLSQDIKNTLKFGLNDTITLRNISNTDFESLKKLDGNDKFMLNGLFRSFEQAANGYSIILFGYGLSGSGKTYSLTGEFDTKNSNIYKQGEIMYGLEYLSQNGCTIEIAQIFEQYYDDTYMTNDDSNKLKEIGNKKTQFKEKKIKVGNQTYSNSEIESEYNEWVGKQTITYQKQSQVDVEYNDNVKINLTTIVAKLSDYSTMSHTEINENYKMNYNKVHFAIIDKLDNKTNYDNDDYTKIFIKFVMKEDNYGELSDEDLIKFYLYKKMILSKIFEEVEKKKQEFELEIKREEQKIGFYNEHYTRRKIISKLIPLQKTADKTMKMKMNLLFCRLYLYYCDEELKGNFEANVKNKMDQKYVYTEDVKIMQDYGLYENSTFSKIKLINILNTIKDHRKQCQRIKKTMNNEESSRSHLYIVFKITNSNNEIGYVTIVDMGGRENPYEISKYYFKSEVPITGEKYFTEDYNDEHIDTEKISSYKDFKIIFDEGYFINETINHLIYYLKNKIHNDVKIITISGTDAVELRTLPGEQMYTLQNIASGATFASDANYTTVLLYNLSNVDEHNIGMNVGMIPILEYLDNLTPDIDKPTKFICLMCIRQEKDREKETIQTLKFADQIKST